ncbi:MAG: N,N-dimethylformamidase beta subunit family domain-containing protein, partial [Candidatus Eisenbacteria bacterium]
MTHIPGQPTQSCVPVRATLGLLWSLLLLAIASPASALNAIQIENALPGTPAATWDITGAGDPSIQGFATDISVNRGGTITFKIQTDAAAYHIDIYRLGYYQGAGARQQGSGVVTASLPQTQPAPLTDAATGLIDCGNWSESAHWDVPGTAVSGIYIARLVRDDTQGASHVAFIVRDDAATGGILFKTADATWQAYNGYGGNSLYVGTAPRSNGNAAKVSYNRPFLTRAGGGGSGSSEDWLFNAEYPMVRWLESNGYDVRYTTDVDADRSPAALLQAQVLLTAGHDEYWSGGERAAFEAARAAGVHQAFFTGNEVYWKTRWEPSIDGPGTAHRTLVCYKEGTLGENNCGGRCDPLAGAWTGLWRDGCAFPTLDGCRPENALTGQISWLGTTAAITVPDTYKSLRFWRDTAVAALGAGQTHTLPTGTLGYEWDYEQFAANYPSGRIKLSSTANSGQTHHLSLYRHTSGALVFGAGTVQWSWGLDATHDRGNEPASLTMQQATVNLFADMGVQPETLQPGLVAATASADALAPASTVSLPLAGASIPSGTPFTITGSAAEVGGGVLVGVEVSTDGGATWQSATGTTVWSLSWTPSTLGAVTIMSRGFDDSGNLESTAGPGANVITVTVTTAPPPACPCTVFQPGDAPTNPLNNDGQPIELGMKFRSSVDGTVTAIRYYKGAGTTGTHLGHLWSAAGVQLAEVTFTGETASGWQEATLSSPVAITANTTYVVSQHSASGDYPFTNPYFTSAVVNGPLRALANGEEGPNAVYAYTAAPSFPTSNFQSSNYFVDVVFATAAGPDVTPPTVTSTVPAAGASGVVVGTSVAAVFNEPLDPLTVTGANVVVTGPGATVVPGSVSYLSATRTVQFVPAAALAYSTLYTVTLTGGPGGLADAAGNALAANGTWTFTTGAPPPPPPSEGPGGPILVISSAANPFSRYPVEILRTEGLNAFTAMDLSLVTPALLTSYDVVVLGECALSSGDVTMLSDWTAAGGTLIAFRPDAQLAPLLGLTPAGGTLANGYLLVNTATAPGTGIVSQTMQFHGSADLYTLSGASAVATLYSDASTPTSNPAVTMHSVGSNGGRAIAFTYDLARSVVYTRQGNPAWTGTKRDGQIEPIRSDDLFYGPAAADPQPDWIDFNKIAIPQADEQQRLLANAITLGNLHRMPLPRFWYLPKGLKAAIVMTGDDHGDAGMQPRFDIYRAQSPPGCSVDDWECVRATGYLYLGTAFTPAQATFYKNLGFEVSLHINTNCARYTPAEYENFVASQSAAFTNLYPDIPLVSNRNHCIAFPDWSTTPEVESAHGIRFDTNYYYWPAAWVQDRPGLFTGSGMPMRFAKLDGTLIDAYQAVTQMPDEAGESFPAFCDALLDRANGPEGYYGVFTTNMHFDQASHAGSDAIVASAQAHGVPVVSSQQMLEWLDGRNSSSFGNLAWTANQLSFSLAVGSGARNLRGMLPLFAATGQLTTLTRAGNPVTFTTETIKGIAYAFFPADAGAYAATYEVDTSPPVVSTLTATPTSGTTATITWTTDEPSDSQVEYGTSPGSLTLTAGSLPLVTSHSVTLSGLAAGATIHYRVRSTDAAANEATEPAPPAAPATFTLPATPCFVDATAADFAQGTPDAGTAIALTNDGEVILAPAVLADFDGGTLPAGWTSGAWNAGGAATVATGVLSIDGARAYTTASFGPGRSLEFRATFSATTFQNIGFATDGDFNSPWVVIGQGSAPGSVYARMDGAGDVLISNEDTKGFVTVDALQFLPEGEVVA